MVFLGYKRVNKGYLCFNPATHKVHLSRDVIFNEGHKWNFMERQSSEGMELRDLGVNLRFENPSVRMEEGAENLEGVLQDMPSNEGSTLTRLNRMVVECTRLSVKIKS